MNPKFILKNNISNNVLLLKKIKIKKTLKKKRKQ